MRLRIQHPLFVGFLGVIGLQVALIVVLVGSGLRRELDETFQVELGRHLAMGAALISGAPGADPDSLARVITERIDYRVTILQQPMARDLRRIVITNKISNDLERIADLATSISEDVVFLGEGRSIKHGVEVSGE